MRLIAVSIVKNEADIIEPFVRHTLALVDHLLVFDHDSTDGTREILGALAREQPALELFTGTALANLQQERSNHLTRVATDHGADWILPLDADEILVVPDRLALERTLAHVLVDRPVSLPLVNYYPTDDDGESDNPVTRLRYCQRSPSTTRKIFIPRALAVDKSVTAGKGSHALYRNGTELKSESLPGEFHLAHLALRSPPHQVLRVILAELQKLSRGRAHEGLDIHYRLGYQLLAEEPEKFLALALRDHQKLRLLPITYRGSDLRFSGKSGGWDRVARALLPFLEKMARSHGELRDAVAAGVSSEAPEEVRALAANDIPSSNDSTGSAFEGFTALEGLAPFEGPVPEAFLPVFRWGLAPATRLKIDVTAPRARLVASALSYTEGQRLTVRCNGVVVLQHVFARVNEKVSLTAALDLAPDDNELVLEYSQSLQTSHDPRKLAVIFLSLRIVPLENA